MKNTEATKKQISDELWLLKIFGKTDNFTFSDILVMAAIVEYAKYKENNIAELSANDIYIDYHKNLSRSTIFRSIARLEANHFIAVIRNGGKKNRYKVLIPIPTVKPEQIMSENDYIAEATKAALSNPFIKIGDDDE